MRTDPWAGPRRAARCLALVLAVAGGALLYGLHFTPSQRAARLRLAEADAQAQAAINVRLKPLYELFERGEKGSKEFADEVTSLSGKWALIKGAVDGASHREHVARAFARNVLDKDELKAAIEAACQGYADDLLGVEADLLVKLRADLDELGHPAARSQGDAPRAFAAEYARMVDRVVGQVNANVPIDVGRLAAAEIGAMTAMRAAGQAARAAAVELGLQGTVLGSGFAVGVVSLGVGILAAVIVDYVLAEVLRLFGYDAERKIAAEVDAALDRMRAALVRVPQDSWVWGNTPPGALRAELMKLHAARADVRQQAVALLIRPGSLRAGLESLDEAQADLRQKAGLLVNKGGVK